MLNSSLQETRQGTFLIIGSLKSFPLFGQFFGQKTKREIDNKYIKIFVHFTYPLVPENNLLNNSLLIIRCCLISHHT